MCLPINAEGNCGLSITALKINRQVYLPWGRLIASVNAVHTPHPVGYDSISKIKQEPMRTNNVNRGAHSKKKKNPTHIAVGNMSEINVILLYVMGHNIFFSLEIKSNAFKLLS